MLNLSPENVERIRHQSDSLDLADINFAIIELSRTMSEAKWSTQPRILLELCVVKLSTEMMEMTAAPARPAAAVQTRPKPQPQAAAAKPAPAVQADPADPDRGTAAGMDFDYDTLWHAVFEEAEASKGSFNLIRNGTYLSEITADNFTLTASNATVMGFVENNREALENLMEKHTGRRRGLRCVMEDEGACASKNDVEKLAQRAENKLGLNIEIE